VHDVDVGFVADERCNAKETGLRVNGIQLAVGADFHPTNGLHIARLAARLRRGWVGVYVTTSYFSIPVQREVLSDRYPILFVDGARLAVLVRGHLQNSGVNLADFLGRITLDYERKVPVSLGSPCNTVGLAFQLY
jgi:hypothetical protein